MLDSELTKEILISFAGTLLALLLAGVLWFLKQAYEKHRREVLALAKFDRIFAMNITLLRDNFEFMGEWLEALKQDRPFSFHFEKYRTNEEETYKISNLKLINLILDLNYKLNRTSLDLENLYKSYWKVISKIDSIPDPDIRTNAIQRYHGSVRETIQDMKQNYEPLRKELVEVLALTRANHEVRRHSLFGYLSFLFKDIFPRVSEDFIKAEVKRIEKQIEERLHNNKNGES